MVRLFPVAPNHRTTEHSNAFFEIAMVIPADLAPESIQARLRSRVIGRPLEVLGEVGSTNDRVMAAGRDGAPEGLALITDRQTAGRGRLGRPWASPPGVGLYTSILLRPTLPARRAPLLTLVAGLAVVEAIENVAGLAPRLKWPNDLLVNGKKIAGILTETASVESRVSYVVVGIGINVHHDTQDLPEELRATATSLRLATGREIPRGDLAAEIYNGLDRWYREFSEGRFETILARGRERSAILGSSVDVLAEDERWSGRAVDLDADGALLVREKSGAIRRVVAGDVSIRLTH
jgi:BirA family biotin operon repressor/biotin-[acetyl-CoA-carboxylase] ligase